MKHDLAPARSRRLRSPPPPPSDEASHDNTTTAAADEPPIPLLRSTMASIFVPLLAFSAPSTLLAFSAPSTPSTPSSSRVAQLQGLLADHDAHDVQVRANMRALVRRECIRILRELAVKEARLAAAAAAESGRPSHSKHQHAQPSAPAPAPAPRHRVSLTPADRAAMISNMEASPDGVAPEVVPQPDLSLCRPPASVREWAHRELLIVVSRALFDLKSYGVHVARRRASHQQALKREIERAAL